MAEELTEYSDIAMDVDGELSFHLKLTDRRLVLADLRVAGSIYASIYDADDNQLQHMPTATEESPITALKSGQW